MLRLLHSLGRALEMNRATREPSAGDVCVACEGHEGISLAIEWLEAQR